MIAIDTHAVIWDALSSGKLTSKAKGAIEKANEEDGIILCDISLWEIAMLIKKRRLEEPISRLSRFYSLNKFITRKWPVPKCIENEILY